MIRQKTVTEPDILPPQDNKTLHLFVTNITEIYQTKSKLIDFIPLMVKKASQHKIKTLLLNTGITINSQLLKINIILAILKQNRIVLPNFPAKIVDLDSYLGNDLQQVSSEGTDLLLLTHLIMIEGMEIDAFRLLKKMAAKLHHKWIYDMLEQNMISAVRNKKILEDELSSAIG